MRKLAGTILILIGLFLMLTGLLAMFAEFLLGIFILLISVSILILAFKLLFKDPVAHDNFYLPAHTKVVSKEPDKASSNQREFSELPTQRMYKNEEATKVFFVVGNYKGDLRKNMSTAVQKHVERYNNKEYDNASPGKLKRLVENYNRIFKYDQMNVKSVILVDEPDNPYDANAIAVYFKDYKVGYIRRNETALIHDYKSKGYTYFARIMGGPFITLSIDDELLEKNEPYKMEIVFKS